MIPYHSGIASTHELNLVQLGAAKRILVDRIDFRKLQKQGVTWTQKTALDSGAYKLFKAGATITQDVTLQYLIEGYFELAVQQGVHGFEFVTAMDVFGDADRTWWCWEYMRARQMHERVPLVPVWGWGGDRARLHTYLDQASLVGIGGLVPLLRAHDEQVLTELIALCAEFPGRFHLFGLCWVKAINALKETGYSFDSSIWLDSKRYGHVFFIDTRTGKLSKAPASAGGDGALTPGQLAVKSVKAIEAFLHD